MWYYHKNGFSTPSFRIVPNGVKARLSLMDRDWQREQGNGKVTTAQMDAARFEMTTVPQEVVDCELLLTESDEILARRVSNIRFNRFGDTAATSYAYLTRRKLRHTGLYKFFDEVGVHNHAEAWVDPGIPALAAKRTGYHLRPYELLTKWTPLTSLQKMWTSVYAKRLQSQRQILRWDDIVPAGPRNRRPCRLIVQCCPSEWVEVLVALLARCACENTMYLDVDKLKHVQAFGDTFSGCFKGGWYVLFVEDKLQAAVFAHAEFNLHEGGYWDVVFDYPAFDLAYYSEIGRAH